MRVFLANVFFLLLMSLQSMSVAKTPAYDFIQRTKTEVKVDSAYKLSAYLNHANGQLLVHLKSKERNVVDQFIDARTGMSWHGDAETLNRDFSVYGFETVTDVADNSYYDQLMMRQLGCTFPVTLCTSIENADLVLFVSFLKDEGRLQFEVVELQRLFKQLDGWLSGENADNGSQFGERDWLLLAYAARSRQKFEHWVDQIRSVDTAKNWLQLEFNLMHGPQLEKRSLGFNKESGFELRSEVELAGLKITLRSLLSSWVVSGYKTQAFEPIANFLSAINGANSDLQNGVTTQTLDLLLELSKTQKDLLAEQLDQVGRKRKSHTIWAYGEWLKGRDGAVSPWLRTPAIAADVSAQRQSNDRKKPPVPLDGIPVTLGISSDLGTQKTSTNTILVAANINHELSLIRALKNELVLMAFNETSGKLNTESGEVAGFSFVARAIGSLQDGRFELQILPNAKAALRLTHGTYRVKVSVSLEHSREEECISGYRCYFSSKKTFAKSQTSALTFRINNLNQFRDKQICNFGPLLPEAGGNYRNILKAVRLAVTGARVDPQ